MRDLIRIDEGASGRAPAIVALDEDLPPIGELFTFMEEAELRFDSLRMRIVDRTFTTQGERIEEVEVLVRHPGRAKVVSRRESAGLARDFDIWVSDGELVKVYDARSNTASIRPVPSRVVGATHQELPTRSRVYVPRTALPVETLAETFIHPRGFCRNVLATGPISYLGTTTVADREAFLLRADHPRTSHVLTDRPDRWLEVGVDRMTGLVVLLVEHVGDRLTRDAEATSLELDPVLPDDAFQVYLSSDVRMIY